MDAALQPCLVKRLFTRLATAVADERLKYINVGSKIYFKEFLARGLYSPSVK